ETGGEQKVQRVEELIQAGAEDEAMLREERGGGGNRNEREEPRGEQGRPRARHRGTAVYSRAVLTHRPGEFTCIAPREKGKPADFRPCRSDGLQLRASGLTLPNRTEPPQSSRDRLRPDRTCDLLQRGERL